MTAAQEWKLKDDYWVVENIDAHPAPVAANRSKVHIKRK